MSSENLKKQMVVNGFRFENSAEAVQAQKEADGVKYIQEKTDMSEPDTVCQIYNKMIQQKLFETAVGFSYLKNLQEYLLSIPFINKEDILPIPVQHPVLEEHIKRTAKVAGKGNDTKDNRSKKQKCKEGDKKVHTEYKVKFQVLAVVCVVLTACVIGMFIVSATSNNLTILNYENKLINRYEEWEKELDAREAVILERERFTGITEE